MDTGSKKFEKWSKNMGLVGMGLCALCCALPVIGIIGGTGLLTMISLYAEKVAIVLFIISGGLFAFWLYKKKQAPPACSVDCSCKTDDSKSESESVNTK
jgi:mercuric ion transport protein